MDIIDNYKTSIPPDEDFKASAPIEVLDAFNLSYGLTIPEGWQRELSDDCERVNYIDHAWQWYCDLHEELPLSRRDLIDGFLRAVSNSTGCGKDYSKITTDKLKIIMTTVRDTLYAYTHNK